VEWSGVVLGLARSSPVGKSPEQEAQQFADTFAGGQKLIEFVGGMKPDALGNEQMGLQLLEGTCATLKKCP
jgi:hypothetical protein